MKTIHANNHEEESANQPTRLNEGEEISLGIEPKKPQDQTIEMDRPDAGNEAKYQQITRLHHGGAHQNQGVAPHAQGDLQAHINKPNDNSQLQVDDIEVQNFPKIDLAPDEEHMKDNSKKGKGTARQKLAELRSHKHWHNAKLVIGTVLVFLLIFNSQWFISQFMYLFNKPKVQTNSQQTQNQPEQQDIKKNEAEVVGPQNEIIIPKIGVTAPLVFINTTNESEVLVALRDGVVHYYGTAMPGENGNAAFFGHSSNDWWEPGNYKFIFVLLEKLSVGDTYEIHYNSRKYVYLVTQTKIVAPNDLSVLNQTSEPTSTLITCTPPGTSWQRFVVSAKQISPIVEKQAQTQPTQTQQTQKSQQQTLPGAAPSLWQQFTGFFSGLFGQKKQSSNQDKTSNQQNSNQHLPEVN